jgi:hypothetical protein
VRQEKQERQEWQEPDRRGQKIQPPLAHGQQIRRATKADTTKLS